MDVYLPDYALFAVYLHISSAGWLNHLTLARGCLNQEPNIVAKINNTPTKDLNIFVSYIVTLTLKIK